MLTQLKIQEKDDMLMLVDHYHYHKKYKKQEYWLKLQDAYRGYSWDYFMPHKSSTTALLRRHLLYLKA
jgi:hypothetical protein